LNGVVTGVARTACDTLGHTPEALIRHLHRVGTVRRRLPNGRTLVLWSRADDWISNQIFWRGWDGYEPETTRVFYTLALRARVTLDVGAYVGFYSLLAAHANPSGRVFAFEPHPAVFERLALNVRANGVANVTCHAVAAGATDGAANFHYVPGGLPSSSSLSLPFMTQSGAPLEHRRVPVVALDSFAREAGLDHVDLVKVDTETTEPDVLEGMASLLERHRPHVFCEVLAGRADEGRLEAILRPLGYRFYLLKKEGPTPAEHVGADADCLNQLFVHETRTGELG
jgi:FkbM family methyltransferase